MADNDERPNLTLLEPEAVPEKLDEARDEAARCRRCPLHLMGTQTVFGEGPVNADVLFVGEQPGDKEDRQGRPFVGPAGQLFDKLLEEAGIDRGSCYVTNAVKHFKFEQRGKLRLHKKPATSEVEACRWWLDIELALVNPKLVVALGATAAQSLTGNGRDILKRRGTFETTREGRPVLITVHPSALLRIPDPEVAERARATFLRDLALVTERLHKAA
jgi:DNA polymerase